jgi:hypothetical protein
MENKNEIIVSVQGTEVIETTSTSKTFDKVEYLVQKEKELEEHDLGVTAYIESSNAKRAELVKLIADING